MAKSRTDQQPAIAPTPALPVTVSFFSYIAQTSDGFRMSGSIEATDGAAAIRALESMNLRVIEVTAPPPPAHSSSNEEFLAFHRRLAQVVEAGMPLEKGMRLI